jgi:protein Tex
MARAGPRRHKEIIRFHVIWFPTSPPPHAKDPREVVKPGDIVRVKVLEVDMARKRIALTLRLDDEVGPRADHAGTAAPRNDGGRPPPRVPSRNAAPVRREEQGSGALADALRRAGLAEKRK